MKYREIVEANFCERPNRFIAYCKVGNETEKVHVKNTGRCGELLLPGARVYLEKSNQPTRSTQYDLVAVWKGDRLVNMDSQAPNAVVREWLCDKERFPDICSVKPECVYGNSRFDFYLETKNEKIFIEVKGVTREQDNVVCFPDAPSERAIKHVEELVQARQNGYRAIVLFVVQMEAAEYFVPDVERHPAFCDALRAAHQAGVEVYALECKVKPDEMWIHKAIPVSLDGKRPLCLVQDETQLKGIIKPLVEWYEKGHRALPWRDEPSAYRVWISEIMLQQTRVEAVKPYYERFMNALPDIHSLSCVEEESLLKLWEGLGYYNRARNLKKAAQVVCESFQGEMPGNYEELINLPGIGSYTAGAISSIAFREPFPAVDGNVLRVLARIRMDDRNIADSKVKESIERELKPVMYLENPGSINQGFMELGATVCVPNGRPHCESCPLAGFCLAHKSGREQEYPKKSSKKQRKVEEKTVLIIEDMTKIAIRKRPEKGLLAGLYEFPVLEGWHTKKQVIAFLTKQGIQPIRVQPAPDAKHIFSHIEWHMKSFRIKVDSLEKLKPSGELETVFFVEKEEMQISYPLPSAFEAYYELLALKQGKKNI